MWENFISLHVLEKISKRTESVFWKRLSSSSQSDFTSFLFKSISTRILARFNSIKHVKNFLNILHFNSSYIFN